MWLDVIPWMPSTTGRPGRTGEPACATVMAPPTTGASKYLRKGSLLGRDLGECWRQSALVGCGTSGRLHRVAGSRQRGRRTQRRDLAFVPAAAVPRAPPV